jgi:uncharacterized protein (DUF2267 family)
MRLSDFIKRCEDGLLSTVKVVKQDFNSAVNAIVDNHTKKEDIAAIQAELKKREEVAAEPGA